MPSPIQQRITHLKIQYKNVGVNTVFCDCTQDHFHQVQYKTETNQVTTKQEAET